MAILSTIYELKLRYLLDDKASKGMDRLADNADRAAKRTGMLSSGLKRIAAIGVGAFGLHKASKALIGFNSDMQQARTTMSGMIQLNLGGEWSDNMEKANTLVANFQERAKKSVGTTKDFVDMAQLITRPVTAAGLGMKELEDITVGAGVAARAFSMQAEVAALDIEQVLMGTMAKKDRFARALLEPIFKMHGLTIEKFNKLDSRARASMLLAALTSDTIRDMSEAQAGSFAGVMSTFQDSLQRFLGSVGLPLFKAITVEVQKWNTWIERNPQKIQDFADKFAGALVAGFNVIKSVAGFLVKHSGTILAIAKAWAAIKIGGLLGKGLAAGGALLGTGLKKGAAFAGMLGFDKVMMSSAKMGAGLMSTTAKLGAWGAALGLGGLAIKGLYDLFTKEDREREKKRKEKMRKEMETIEKFGPIAMPSAKAAGMKQFAGGAQTRLRNLMTEMMKTGMTAPEAKELAPGRLLEIQRLQADLKAVQPEMQAYYQNLAKQAQELGLFNQEFLSGQTDLRSEVQRGNIDFEAASAAMARNLGLSSQYSDYFASDLIMLASKINTANDRTKAFGDMLEGEFTPSIMSTVSTFLAGLAPTDPTKAAQDEALKKALADTKGGKSRVNVTIQKIEVQSDDPDRFVHGMVSALSDAAKNPSGALDTFREG